MNYLSSLKLQNFFILKNLSAGKNKNYHKYLRNEFEELQETTVFILFVLELLLLTFNKNVTNIISALLSHHEKNFFQE